MHGRRALLLAGTAVFLWLFVGAVVYYSLGNCSRISRFDAQGLVFEHEQCPWTFAQSFYFSVQTGLSIGFGLLSESKTASMVYSMFHILAGSSVIGGALAMFAELALEGHQQFMSQEEESLAKASAKLHHNNYEGFDMVEMRELMVRYPHYARGIIRKVFADSEEAERQIERFQGAPRVERVVMAKEILRQACMTVEEFKNHRLTVEQIDLLDKEAASMRTKAIMWARGHRNSVTISVAFLVWFLIGMAFSMAMDKRDAVTAAYFAISTLSTAGMVAVRTVEGQAHVVFTAVFALIGVPIYGLFLGQFANIFVERYNAKQVQKTLSEKCSEAEVQFLQHMTANDHKEEVDLAEFVEFQLLRLGKIDRDMIQTIREHFNRLDEDGSGRVSKSEFMGSSSAPRHAREHPEESHAASEELCSVVEV